VPDVVTMNATSGCGGAAAGRVVLRVEVVGLRHVARGRNDARDIRNRFDDWATKGDRWWRYLVLSDYYLRERLGYTTAEACWALAVKWRDHMHRIANWADAAQKWGSK
jgi:hypothetical protein